MKREQKSIVLSVESGEIQIFLYSHEQKGRAGMLERFLDQIGEVLRLCEDTDGILVVNREGSSNTTGFR